MFFELQNVCVVCVLLAFMVYIYCQNVLSFFYYETWETQRFHTTQVLPDGTQESLWHSLKLLTDMVYKDPER